jgi:hypothetical protein
MATYEDLQAAVDAIKQAHPGWNPGQAIHPVFQPMADTLQLQLNRQHGLQAEVPDSVFAALRQLAPPGSFTPSGQLVNAPDGSPNLPSPHAPMSPPQHIPGPPPPGTPVDRTVAAPQNALDQLRNDPVRKLKNAKGVPHDPIPTYVDGYKAMQDVTENGPGNTGWDTTINAIRDRLKRALRTLDSGIEGQFADALRSNVERSFAVLDDMSNHAQAMETLIGAFFNDLSTTKGNFAKNWELYRQAMQDPEEPNNKETLNQLNALVGPIMAQYRPPIDGIAASHPSISSALPSVGSPGPAAGPGGGLPGASGGGIPVGLPMNGLNSGIPAPATPNGLPPDRASTPSMPTIPSDAANGAADAAKQAGDQAQKAAGQAGNAGQKALDALTGAQNGAGLPVALGLGPKGVQGASKTGTGAAGRRGAGAGRDPGAVKTPAKLTSAAMSAGTAVPASRAGVSGAGAPGGAGVPAAGHRGAAGDKTHKASKALRLTKNGEELMGDADAVTSVIGEEPRKVPPADPKT